MPSLLNQDLTSQSAAADTDVPEDVQSQAGSMQIAPTALQTCWNKVKKPFAGSSRHGNQQVCKGLTHSTAEATLGHVDMLEADKSVLAPAADQDQQVLIRAVTATGVPGIPPQLQMQDLQQQQQSISNCDQRLSSQTKDQVEMQDLQQQQQQAISSCGPGLLSQKKGLVEKEELLTDHEAAADMRRHSSCEEQVQQPAEGQSAESIR